MFEMLSSARKKDAFWISVVVVLFVIAGISLVVNPSDDFESENRPGASLDRDAVLERVSGIGDTVDTAKGLAVTLQSVENNPEIPDTFLLDDPLGRYVAVGFLVSNESNEPVTVYRRTIVGTIDSRKYDAAALFSPDGSTELLREINPGLSAAFVAYFDIPPGASLTHVEFDVGGVSETLTFSATRD